jgi:hypothetical protein
MNALAKTLQDNDLSFSPGLFLPGLKIDKLDGIHVDRQKRVINLTSLSKTAQNSYE